MFHIGDLSKSNIVLILIIIRTLTRLFGHHIQKNVKKKKLKKNKIIRDLIYPNKESRKILQKVTNESCGAFFLCQDIEKQNIKLEWGYFQLC